jgi:hypothetical protein
MWTGGDDDCSREIRMTGHLDGRCGNQSRITGSMNGGNARS